MEPTASAVVGDLMAIARNMLVGAGRRTAPLGFLDENIGVVPIQPMGETVCTYYLRFNVLDRPGILAKIAGALGENGISIKSAIQTAKSGSGFVPLVIVTHEARETDVNKALATIRAIGITSENPALIRIEDDL